MFAARGTRGLEAECVQCILDARYMPYMHTLRALYVKWNDVMVPLLVCRVQSWGFGLSISLVAFRCWVSWLGFDIGFRCWFSVFSSGALGAAERNLCCEDSFTQWLTLKPSGRYMFGISGGSWAVLLYSYYAR